MEDANRPDRDTGPQIEKGPLNQGPFQATGLFAGIPISNLPSGLRCRHRP